MKVSPKDGTCRECRGELKIIDADDATLTVRCQQCGAEYLVEIDAFGDGGLHFWPEFSLSTTFSILPALVFSQLLVFSPPYVILSNTGLCRGPLQNRQMLELLRSVSCVVQGSRKAGDGQGDRQPLPDRGL